MARNGDRKCSNTQLAHSRIFTSGVQNWPAEPPTPFDSALRGRRSDLHRRRSPLIHHIQRVITITDIPRAIRENEIGLAKAELCPSPETDLDAARQPFPSAP